VIERISALSTQYGKSPAVVGQGLTLSKTRCMPSELKRTTGDLRIGFVDWNDAPERTKADVIDLIQRAANRAGGGDA
jgi:hypothetical protein